MRVELRSHHVDTSPALKSFVRRRVAFALDRYVDRLRGVTVRLEDTNGPKGGLDKACRVQVDAPGEPPMMAAARAEDAYAAVALALERAAVVVDRRLDHPAEQHRVRRARRRAG